MKYSDTINFVNRDDKKLLGGIQMNTKTFEQFDVMTDEALSTVEGGGWKCVAGTAGGSLSGYVVGLGVAAGYVAAASNPVGWVVGSAIIAGTAGGGLTGAATFC